MMISIQIALFLLAVLTFVPITQRFGIPSLLGYILAGLIIAPLFSLIFETSFQITKFVEIALCILAFYLGTQIQLKDIWQVKASLKPNLIYMGVTGVIFSLIVWLIFQLSVGICILVGFTFSLSSNIFIQQWINIKKNVHPESIQSSLHLLKIQKFIAILLLAIVPLFSTTYTVQHSMAYMVALIAVISGFLLFNRYILRPLFKWIAEKSIAELTVVLVTFVSLCTFAITQLLGMPIFLSALLSGLMLADSDLKLNLENYIQPFFGLILSLTALAIGYMIDLNNLYHYIPQILLCTFAIIMVKLIVMLVIKFIKYRKFKSYFEASVLPAQGSEFAFLIFACAAYYQLMLRAELSAFILIIAISILLTPFSLWIANYFKHIDQVIDPDKDQRQTVEAHTLIIGFGRFGQMMARIAHVQQQPFVIIDRRFESLDFLKQYQGRYIQGDITDQSTIDTLNLDQTKICILAIDQVEDSLHIARYIRLHYPQLAIVSRARDHYHAHLLAQLGIEYIHIEAQALALEMSKHMLMLFGQDHTHATTIINEFDEYNMFILKQQQYVSPHHTSFTQPHRNTLVDIENLFENDAFMLKHKAHSTHLDRTAANSTHRE